MVPVAPLGQDKVVNGVPKVGAGAVATVEVAVPTLPQISRTATVYVPGGRVSNTDELWKGLVTGEGDKRAYWKVPGAPEEVRPVPAVAVTLIVPVAVPAQEALFTIPTVGAVLGVTVKVARLSLPQASIASTV